MRIVHGQDYYDGAHAGIDPEIVFVRDGHAAETIDLDALPFSPRNRQSRSSSLPSFSLAYVFFCGDVYPIMRVRRYTEAALADRYTSTRNEGPSAKEMSFDYEGQFDLFNKSQRRDDDPKFLQDANYTPGFGWKEPSVTDTWVYDLEAAMAVLQECIDGEPETFLRKASDWKPFVHDHFKTRGYHWTQWLIDHRIVVGYLQSNSRNPLDDRPKRELIVNSDVLRRVDFYQIKDAFTAFQDIQSYVGGVLPANDADMVQISNRSQIEKAGFDTKTSFRKAPGTKRGKKRA